MQGTFQTPSADRHFPRAPRGRRVAARSRTRRGSVLLVVIGLLGLLMLVGFTFFTFASQERNSAEYFSEAYRKPQDKTLSTEVLWDFALQQIIAGPADSNRQSVLWGKRHSLLPNMLGSDVSPYDGRGINLMAGAGGQPFVDQNRDGTADGFQGFLDLNDSPAATTTPGMYGPDGAFGGGDDLIPDVDYTYPDVNNLFLAWRGYTRDASNNLVPVIIPSFHRPQTLRDNAGPIPDWTINTATSRRILRPHKEHVVAGKSTRRYLSVATARPTDGVLVQPFPGLTTSGKQGVWSLTDTNTAGLQYEFDVDNDGDGVKEGVWLDLGFPVQTLADGRKYVPMFSATILDADGLINLNTAGNLAKASSLARPFGDGASVSGSNQALTPSEINPWWALNADPQGSDLPGGNTQTDFLKQYETFLTRFSPGGMPNSDFASQPTTRAEMSNLDLLFSLWGRPEYTGATTTIAKLHEGRWGELSRLQAGLQSTDGADFPRPGRADVDDDGDRYEGEATTYEAAWVHPLDFAGAGSMLNLSGHAWGYEPALAGLNAGDTNRWLFYRGYHTRGSIRYMTAGMDTSSPTGGNLMYDADLTRRIYDTTLNPQVDATEQLLDHPVETIVEPAFKQSLTGIDQIFEPSEMEGLHRNDNDPDHALVVSRLRSLMPWNLQLNARAAAIRERFTTDSWDRTQFSLHRPQGLRAWEFSGDSNSDGRVEFPPLKYPLSGGHLDRKEPFRPALRKLLQIDEGNLNDRAFQFRLNLNQLADIDPNQMYRGNPSAMDPPDPNRFTVAYENLTGYYRNLTQHPADPGREVIPTTANYPTGVPNVYQYWTSNGLQAEQEFWARRDRQLLARDIYVMLYMLCGGQDVNPLTTSNANVNGMGFPTARVVYNDDQLREMAQFAVNIVDAQDTDDVITRFEYDKDLSDGWNLDDNAYTSEFTALQPSDTGYNADFPLDSTEHGVVWGVERQQLTFSEAMVVLSKRVRRMAMSIDHPGTLYDDAKPGVPTEVDPEGRFFTFVELHNASPFSVAVNNSNWKIRVRYKEPGAAGQYVEKDLTLRDTTSPSVGAGKRYTIGTTDTDNQDVNGQRPTEIRIKPTWSPDQPPPTDEAEYVKLAPAGNLTLDLAHSSGDKRFETAAGSNPAAGMALLTNADPLTPVTFHLYRREHTGRTSPQAMNSAQQADNGWVRVDTLRDLDIVRLEFADWQGVPVADAAAAFLVQIQKLKSRERVQPLDRNTVQLVTQDANFIGNSLGLVNRSTQTNFNDLKLWQPHFDRDFASPMELLSIPLYSPANLTRLLAYNGSGATREPHPAYTAQAKILRPDGPDDYYSDYEWGTGGTLLGTEGDKFYDNRWYRLFEFVQVDNRAHRLLQNQQQLASPRTPGKINLNTIRHQEVFAALLDEPYTLNLDLTDKSDNNRNWWLQFVEARDQRDPVTQMLLPGLPGSRPFRSLSYLHDGNNSIEHTLFRSLPLDNAQPVNNRRRLFELGTAANHLNSDIDHYTRHRLLLKVAGNSTNRSHVFYAWLSVGFFEAIEPTPGDVQIGAQFAGSELPNHRMFCIIDRSAAEKAGTPPNVNHRALVLFQRTIE